MLHAKPQWKFFCSMPCGTVLDRRLLKMKTHYSKTRQFCCLASMVAGLFLASENLGASPVNAERISAEISAANEVVIYSLEPGNAAKREDKGACVGLCYYGWAVLGQTRISLRSLPVRQIKSWLDKPESDEQSLCFEPRHGVRIVTATSVIDFVVCFECDAVEIYVDAKASGHALSPSNVQVDWDRLLSKAGVRLAQPLE
jgi:hypothetical protein